MPIDQPPAAHDRSHHRTRHARRDLVGRHQRIVVLHVGVFEVPRFGRQAHGELLGQAVAPDRVTLDRLDPAGRRAHVDLEILVSQPVLVDRQRLLAGRFAGFPRVGAGLLPGGLRPDPRKSHRRDLQQDLRPVLGRGLRDHGADNFGREIDAGNVDGEADRVAPGV